MEKRNASNGVLRLTCGPSDIGALKRAMKCDPCSYCGEPADTLDHIVPQSRGGSNSWENLTATCNLCNSQKHAASLLGFLGLRGGVRWPDNPEEIGAAVLALGGLEDLMQTLVRVERRAWRAVW